MRDSFSLQHATTLLCLYLYFLHMISLELPVDERGELIEVIYLVIWKKNFLLKKLNSKDLKQGGTKKRGNKHRNCFFLKLKFSEVFASHFIDGSLNRLFF